MTQALTTPAAMTVGAFNREQLDLLKSTVAAGTSDQEFALFVEVCRSSGLNPFQRQIYAVMRKSWNPDTRQKEKRMVIQTGIDGYRLIAARSGVHAGTSDVEYGPLKDGYPEWARVTVKKLMPGGVIAEFPATARWCEYCQVGTDSKPSGQWPKMPFLMLGKCAEALALRKAFPAELSGVYTKEEMDQADNPAPLRHVEAVPASVDRETGEVFDPPDPQPGIPWKPTQEQIKRLYGIAKENGVQNKDELRLFMAGLEGYPSKETGLNRAQYDELCDVLLPRLKTPQPVAEAEQPAIDTTAQELMPWDEGFVPEQEI